jgi:hypothetical protein
VEGVEEREEGDGDGQGVGNDEGGGVGSCNDETLERGEDGGGTIQFFIEGSSIY